MRNSPDYLRYTTTHAWVEVMDDITLKVGITFHAQQELGDIVSIELPEIEREYTRGDECALVESVNDSTDIYCPVSGSITEINTALDDNPELINLDPYGEGWIFQIEIADDSDLDDLIDAETYNEITEQE